MVVLARALVHRTRRRGVDASCVDVPARGFRALHSAGRACEAGNSGVQCDPGVFGPSRRGGNVEPA
eukprot:9581373-Prorocentrum_lima.AAC.1